MKQTALTYTVVDPNPPEVLRAVLKQLLLEKLLAHTPDHP